VFCTERIRAIKTRNVAPDRLLELWLSSFSGQPLVVGFDPKETLANGSFVECRFAIDHDRVFGLRIPAIDIVLDGCRVN
jgi:hypothetical protein